jgi:hypothetical protein
MDINTDDAMSSDPNRPERRSIRQISKSRPDDRNYTSDPQRITSSLNTESPLYATRRYKSAGKTNWILGIIGVFVLVIIFIAVNSFGAGASVKVTPRIVDASFSNLQIDTNDLLADTLVEEVRFTKEVSQVVKASKEEFVEKKASGTITIYNNFDEKPQTLVTQTRFRSPDGKIFRIQREIVVPGKKGTTPGSVEASVIADEAGEAHNIAASRFAIPGFEGTPRFEGFYAESTKPMEGGFKGTTKIVNEAEERQALEQLQERLTNELRAEASTQIPAFLKALSETSEIVFETLPNKVSGDSIEVRLKGSLTLSAVNLNKLASYIAGKQVPSYAGEAVEFLDMSRVTFNISTTTLSNTEAESGSNSVSSGATPLNVTNTSPIIFTLNEGEIKKELVGLSKNEIDTLTEKFTAIEDIDITIKPFWRRSLPTDESTITLERVVTTSSTTN